MYIVETYFNSYKLFSKSTTIKTFLVVRLTMNNYTLKLKAQTEKKWFTNSRSSKTF